MMRKIQSVDKFIANLSKLEAYMEIYLNLSTTIYVSNHKNKKW